MTTDDDPPLRRLPASELSPAATCSGCHRDIVWSITVAGPNGRGGKPMPLDPQENLAGNVAVRVAHGHRLIARVLTKDEQVDRPVEYVAMPHFASCPVGAHPEPPPQPEPAPGRRQRRRRGPGGRR